jgi:hypothetical protein
MKSVTFNRFIHTIYNTYSIEEYDRSNSDLETHFSIVISRRFNIYNNEVWNQVYNEINEFKKEMKVAPESVKNTRYHPLK